MYARLVGRSVHLGWICTFGLLILQKPKESLRASIFSKYRFIRTFCYKILDEIWNLPGSVGSTMIHSLKRDLVTIFLFGPEGKNVMECYRLVYWANYPLLTGAIHGGHMKSVFKKLEYFMLDIFKFRL